MKFKLCVIVSLFAVMVQALPAQSAASEPSPAGLYIAELSNDLEVREPSDVAKEIVPELKRFHMMRKLMAPKLSLESKTVKTALYWYSRANEIQSNFEKAKKTYSAAKSSYSLAAFAFGSRSYEREAKSVTLLASAALAYKNFKSSGKSRKVNKGKPAISTEVEFASSSVMNYEELNQDLAYANFLLDEIVATAESILAGYQSDTTRIASMPKGKEKKIAIRQFNNYISSDNAVIGLVFQRVMFRSHTNFSAVFDHEHVYGSIDETSLATIFKKRRQLYPQENPRNPAPVSWKEDLEKDGFNEVEQSLNQFGENSIRIFQISDELNKLKI